MTSIFRSWEILALFLAVITLEVLSAPYLPWTVYLDLPLVFALYLGWYSSPGQAALLGTLLGLLQDYISALYLGVNGISLTLIAFTASYLSRKVKLEMYWMRLALTAAACLIQAFLVTGVLWLLAGSPARLAYGEWLWRILITAFLGSVIFQLYDRFKFPRKDFSRLEE